MQSVCWEAPVRGNMGIRLCKLGWPVLFIAPFISVLFQLGPHSLLESERAPNPWLEP